jgi:hypothetical protein
MKPRLVKDEAVRVVPVGEEGHVGGIDFNRLGVVPDGSGEVLGLLSPIGVRVQS